jgi:xanthine dehydrogenase small subunit
MIEFILNNKKIRTEAKTGMSLLHFIRENQGLKGTKSGCKEGDCGACTVLMGTLASDTVSYQSITSCLTPLANVQGKHIVTVEGVNLKDTLNVAQQAIKDNFATQCGFCTPGFVNSLSGLALKPGTVSEQEAIDALSGNICRCTGYKSIEKAAHEVAHKLQEKKNQDNELEWLVQNKFVPSYFKEIPEKLKAIVNTKKENSGVLVAGGTDLYVHHADTLLDQDIQQTEHLVGHTIHINDGICTIDANVKVTQLFENKDLNTYFPALKKHLRLISSEQIRNMASVAGNFVNASPIGDLSIFFLALNSTLKIKNAQGETRLLPFKIFFKDYKKIDLKIDEFIESISFELPDENTYFNFEKVSKRTYLDIAGVNSAISLKVNNSIIYDAHIAVGGVAAIPMYLTKTIRFIKGKELNKTTLTEAQELMQTEITPISDVRGSEQYKRLLARQLFFAHFLTLYPDLFQLKDFVV